MYEYDEDFDDESYSSQDIIRMQSAYILKLEAQIRQLEAEAKEHVDLMVQGVQTKDRMMLDLILCGALTKPSTESCQAAEPAAGP